MLIMKVLLQLNFFPIFLSIKHVEMLEKFLNPRSLNFGEEEFKVYWCTLFIHIVNLNNWNQRSLNNGGDPMQLKNKVRLWQNLVEIGKHFDIFSFQKLNNYTNSHLPFSNLENVQGEGLKIEP